MSNNTFRPLFRGYSKEKKGWVEGAYMAHTEITPNPLGGGPSPIQHLIFKSGFSDWNMPKPIDMHLVVPESVGVFTGIHDKNGKKVFTGDRTKFNGRECTIAYYDKMAAFGLLFEDDTWLHFWEMDDLSFPIEITGNVYAP